MVKALSQTNMATTAALGWYGPLIDLSDASSHVSHFVQLLVFVHRSIPLQFRQSKGGDVIRTDVQVGDNKTPFFSLTLWGKTMSSAFAADVKIVKYGNSVEAKTVQESSLVCLVHSFESLISKDVEDVVKHCRIGTTAKEKLSRVVKWVQKVKPVVRSVSRTGVHIRNWKEQEENESRYCSSVAENVMDTERMFLRRRVYESPNHHLVEDLICTGCQLCGSPLELDSRSTLKKTNVPLYCPRSRDRLHVISSIYKPFMLYVWDEMEHIPILVRNMAATILFGNIKAEKVFTSYKSSFTADAETQSSRKPNIFSIWVILLKLLLKQGKNGPMKFEVDVNNDKDKENGRFEMISVSFPCV